MCCVVSFFSCILFFFGGGGGCGQNGQCTAILSVRCTQLKASEIHDNVSVPVQQNLVFVLLVFGLKIDLLFDKIDKEYT